jgi:hypothetical protein
MFIQPFYFDIEEETDNIELKNRFSDLSEMIYDAYNNNN